MNPERCGYGRCQQAPAMTSSSVPLCAKHWEQCCAESRDSVAWLRDHARDEWVRVLPKEEDPWT